MWICSVKLNFTAETHWSASIVFFSHPRLFFHFFCAATSLIFFGIAFCPFTFYLFCFSSTFLYILFFSSWYVASNLPPFLSHRIQHVELTASLFITYYVIPGTMFLVCFSSFSICLSHHLIYFYILSHLFLIFGIRHSLLSFAVLCLYVLVLLQ